MPGFDAGPETGSETSAGGGGGTVSRSAARREIKAIRTWTEWAAEVRSKDLWEWAQNRRALFIGRFVLPSYLRDPGLLANTRRRVAESGNEVHVELWSDEDLEADYTPAELGR